MKPEDFSTVKIHSIDQLSIKSARDKIWKTRHEGTTCPCCGQQCKVYRRTITRTMVVWLATLVHLWRTKGGRWVDVRDPGFARVPRGGDYARLRHWGLIESQAGKLHTGRIQKGKWRPTEMGALFVDGEEQVQQYAHLYLGKCIKFSGSEISVHDVHGSTFDYADILAKEAARE